MFVNGIDIATFEALLAIKDIQTSDVVTYDDWLRNSLNPLYFGKTEQFKKINVQFVISDAGDNGALTNISNLTKQFEKCTIKFNDVDFYFDCTIASKSNEKLTNGFYTLDVELKSAYGYLPSVTIVLSGTSQTITVPGNLPTPAVVTLTPSIDMSSVTLTGAGKPITISNLHANTPVIIEGEQCLVTESGVNKFSDTDMWAFPVLQPGANTISVDHGGVTVQIVYKPKFI